MKYNIGDIFATNKRSRLDETIQIIGHAQPFASGMPCYMCEKLDKSTCIRSERELYDFYTKIDSDRPMAKDMEEVQPNLYRSPVNAPLMPKKIEQDNRTNEQKSEQERDEVIGNWLKNIKDYL